MAHTRDAPRAGASRPQTDPGQGVGRELRSTMAAHPGPPTMAATPQTKPTVRAVPLGLLSVEGQESDFSTQERSLSLSIFPRKLQPTHKHSWSSDQVSVITTPPKPLWKGPPMRTTFPNPTVTLVLLAHWAASSRAAHTSFFENPQLLRHHGNTPKLSLGTSGGWAHPQWAPGCQPLPGRPCHPPSLKHHALTHNTQNVQLQSTSDKNVPKASQNHQA